MTGDGWTVVGGKGKPKRAQTHSVAAQRMDDAPCEQQSAPEAPVGSSLPGWGQPTNSRRSRGGRMFRERTLEQKVSDHCGTLAEYKREVAAHAVYRSLLAAVATAAPSAAPNSEQCDSEAHEQPISLPHVHQLVVYGLGCIEDSRVSRYQLAFALLVRDLLPHLTSPPELYDPVFSDVDRQIMQTLDLKPIDANECGARAVTTPTLFYLPHCEAALCDNLLAANWSPQQLPLIIILGNSFRSYGDRFSMAGSNSNTKRPERMLQLLKAGSVLEVPVPDHHFHVASAFNDMSLHIFPVDKVAAANILWG